MISDAEPGPLVDAAWLERHLGDHDLRLVHVSPDRSTYDVRHIPGAVHADLHTELAQRGRSAETGEAEREWLVPDRADVVRTLARWGVGQGDRLVFYDDVGQNRHAIRGYWLLRYHGWPTDTLHVLDGGLAAWERRGGAVTSDAAAAPTPRAGPVELGPTRHELLAEADEVEHWSSESTGQGGPIRLLDVRTPEEFHGDDVRAARGGRIPGAVNLPFTEFLASDGTLRPADEIRALAERAVGGDPRSLRAAYCQGGVRAALAWFSLSEVCGLPVANYAGSWEEWGNRVDLPVEAT